MMKTATCSRYTECTVCGRQQKFTNVDCELCYCQLTNGNSSEIIMPPTAVSSFEPTSRSSEQCVSN